MILNSQCNMYLFTGLLINSISRNLLTSQYCLFKLDGHPLFSSLGLLTVCSEIGVVAKRAWKVCLFSARK